MASLSIGQAYQMQRSPTVGIEGYFVQNKYHDPKKMKEEKMILEALSKGEKKPTSLNNKKHKPKESFITDAQKLAAKIPAPGQYNTKEGDFDKVKGPSKSAVKYP